MDKQTHVISHSIVPPDRRLRLVLRKVWRLRLSWAALIGPFLPLVFHDQIPTLLSIGTASIAAILILALASIGVLLCHCFEQPRKVKGTPPEPPVLHVC